MDAIIKLTNEQMENHERLILGVGDTYEYISRRCRELDDLETFEELDRRFREAATIFSQAQVVQEFRERLKV